jgi:pyruvate/2-oxoglutarate dehydrogenase complex dihydrolipoamide dehydrogenase (E3) component
VACSGVLVGVQPTLIQVDDFRSGDQHRLESANDLELIFGEGRFTAPKVVEIQRKAGGTRTLTIGTTSNQWTRFSECSRLHFDHGIGRAAATFAGPGGGYVGLEFGQMFRRFGSAVTVVQHGKPLLGREDPDVAAEVYKLLETDGIEILLETDAVGAHASASGVGWDVRGPRGERTITGSHLLLAVGRVPNSGQLNLAAAGVNVDARDFIAVNDRLETNVAGIYALGDVNGGPAFTHISYDDYRIIRNNLLRRGRSSTKDRLVPYTVYIDPELGRIGLTEQEAQAQGRAIRIAKIPMAWVARAVETAESGGFIKAVVDAETRQILGAAVLGVGGGEIMSMLQIAMMGKLPYSAFEDGIFAHPAFAEGLNTLFMNFAS